MTHHQIGTITKYLPDINTAEIELTESIAIGESLMIGTGEEGFDQVVESIQIDNEMVEKAESGATAAIYVHQAVEEGMPVFKNHND